MKQRRLALCAALLAGNLLLIWGNSLLPGEVSGDISGGLLAWLTGLLGPAREWAELALRKLGHITEFACLGAVLTWLFRLLEQKGFHRFTMPLLCGMAAACVDETIQVFVPDRGPSVVDVWIDTFGLCVGIFLCGVGYTLLHKSRKQFT